MQGLGRSQCLLSLRQSRRPRRKCGLDLDLERLRIKGFDNIDVRARLLRRDYAITVGFPDYNQWNSFEARVSSHFSQEVIAGHRLQVTFRNYEFVALEAHLGESLGTIVRIVNIDESHLPQQGADDLDGRAVVVDREDGRIWVECHIRLTALKNQPLGGYVST